MAFPLCQVRAEKVREEDAEGGDAPWGASVGAAQRQGFKGKWLDGEVVPESACRVQVQ